MSMSQSVAIPDDHEGRASWEGYEKKEKEVVQETAESWLSIMMGVSILKMVVTFFIHTLSWRWWFASSATWFLGVVIGDIGISRMAKLPIISFQLYCCVCIVFGVFVAILCIQLHLNEWKLALHYVPDDPADPDDLFARPHENEWFHADIHTFSGKTWFASSMLISTGYCLFVESTVHIKAIYWTWRLTHEWDKEVVAMEFKDADLYDCC